MALRRYQALWIQLKEKRHLVITLKEVNALTLSQKKNQLRTLRKAVSKEKWKDYHYKVSNPNAEITTKIESEKGRIEFELNPDVMDISHLF